MMTGLENKDLCLYPIDVETAEPVGPRYCVAQIWPHREGLWKVEDEKVSPKNMFTIIIFESLGKKLREIFKII